MYPFLLCLIGVILTRVEGIKNNTFCDGYQTNFNLKNIIGSWWMVAMIPEKMFPDDKKIACYKAEISETDEAGLRWLMNKTLNVPPKPSLEDDLKGTVIRQRYHTEEPFDVWSKSIENINGCFKQIITMDIQNNSAHKKINNESIMQLHLLESNDGPLMVQVLWGKLISAVLYKKNEGVTQDQIKPAFEFVSKIKGPQRLPRVCENFVTNIIL